MESWANVIMKKAFKHGSQNTIDQLKTIGRELSMGTQGNWLSSKEYLDLVKAIGEAKSKAEEESIVMAEIEHLKKRIMEPDVPRKKMKEYIIRLVYVEMLGHDASFGYIYAVKMTHDDNLLCKRSGYLATTLFLNEDHDLIILIVNTIQKDLKSDNYLVVCAALTAVCKLINEETIPAVLPQVVDLLGHPKEQVRKKAVMALHRFQQRSPSSMSHLLTKFRQILCDKDPSVMSAALCALFDLVSADVKGFKNLTASFVSILKQVAEHRLPRAYDYHRTPAPFIQIKLLKILALLGAGDKHASENMYSVLMDVIKRNEPGKGDPGSNITNAILYECICTITAIMANSKLLGLAAEITSRFLKSDSHNYKYMGIDALGRVIEINPDFAEEHQLSVIDCLEDQDDTLKRKTLDLLYKMTKSSNVEVIVDRMISYMRTLSDAHNKTEIATRIIELTERFAPSNQWFIQTMNQVFELAGDLVPVKVAHDLMRLLSKGAGEDDEEADSLLRSSAVESYLQLLAEPKLPSILLQVACWVLGEYGTVDGTHSADDIIGKLCDVAEAHPGDNVVKGYAITAITKICAFEIGAGREVELIPECRSFVDDLLASHSTDLQQRAYELQVFFGLGADLVRKVLPVNGSGEEIEFDRELPFLQEFVDSALANGARPYLDENERLGVDSGMSSFVSSSRSHHEPSHGLRFEAYETPTAAIPSGSAAAPSSLLPDFEESVTELTRSVRNQTDSSQVDLLGPEVARLRLDGVQRKWGRTSGSSQPSLAPTPASEQQRRDSGVSEGASSNKESSPAELWDGDGAEPRHEIYSSSFEGKKVEREIPAEKQRLAASLFGGSSVQKGSSGGVKGGVKASKAAGNVRPGEKGVPPRPAAGSGKKKNWSAAEPKQASSSLMDLVDMSGDDSLPVHDAKASYDPFKELEGLLGVPSTAASSTSVGLGKSTMDFMSLYDSAPVVSQSASSLAGDSDVLSLSHRRSGGMDGANGVEGGLIDLNILPSLSPLAGLGELAQSSSSLSPSTGVSDKKGPSRQHSLQKDAASRQVGVTPTGANPALFQDLFG
ncbi:AP-4 complex subunit epsilon [Physcomitrium patens]|uniref:AP-4 complex subunit epsilon n=1 Tax=Physcomitrium patens TaxID=3218 RepID=UPI000D1534E1|nr:AP-4 complex subunit epsilon-like [Physcomitrium patens]|eukprot:XP_024390606.1 AP-4 complex subunit epsilon-like [Physcomitrella patens]